MISLLFHRNKHFSFDLNLKTSSEKLNKTKNLGIKVIIIRRQDGMLILSVENTLIFS